MKIICISDTHNQHEKIDIPHGDVIIHAGDFTEAGTKAETYNFLNWFSGLPHQHKILVPGNHDFYLEKYLSHLTTIIPQNIHCLINDSIIIDNIKFWGSPVTPGNETWAFKLPYGTAIKKLWNEIPVDVDFLITHGPPYKILDELDNKMQIGCDELEKRIKKLEIPHHIFGHVHHEYGVVRTKKTTYYNVSSINEYYQFVNKPVVINHSLS